MYVNRTAKNNHEKNNFFELLQIRIFLTDDVMTSQFVAMTTKVQHTFSFTVPSTCENFIGIHLSFRDIGRGQIPPLPPTPNPRRPKKSQCRSG